ncbi:MAG: hypothetical protein ACRC6M_19890 [Microcystaceae cyanobacterium]
MESYPNTKLLGVILKDAYILTDAEIQIALLDQKAYGMRLGDVLVLHGWVKKETVDFFTEQWARLLASTPDLNLEECLEASGLLSEAEVRVIRQEQQLTGRDFGAIAVKRGWLRENTLKFFVNNLTRRKVNDSHWYLAA